MMAHRKAQLIVTSLLTVLAGAAAAADKPKAAAPSEPETPRSSEPTRCYRMLDGVDSGMTVGLAVELCSGTPDAIATVSCFAEAFETREAGGLGLNRGQAVWLCRTAGASQRN